MLLRTCGRRLQQALLANTGRSMGSSSQAHRAISSVKSAVDEQHHQHAPQQPGRPDQLPTATESTTDGGREIRTHHSRPRKPQRAPLVRNFFAGAVDTELLTYPEPITRDDMQHLERSVQLTRDYFASVNSEPATAKDTSQQQLSELRKLGAFGRDVPAAWGGHNCTVTELTRHAEVEAADGDVRVAAQLNAHRLAVRCIIECGTVEQQERWLPRLASGELRAAVAFYEADTPATVIFQTRANSDDTQATLWQVNGSKQCVTGAPTADLFVVFAQTVTPDRCGDPNDTVSAFVVERNAHGVHVLPADRTLGDSAEHGVQATVQLKGAAGEPLGEIGGGAVVAQRMLRCARLQSSVLALALQKRQLKRWTEYAVATGGSQEMLLARLSRAHCAAYALESMVYLTTGVLDEYDDADVDVETAAMRVFATETLRRAGTVGLEFAGAQAAQLGSDGSGRLADGNGLCDALQLCSQGETNDALRLFVGLSGTKHAGETLHHVVSKVRNPLYNPAFMFRRLFDSQNIDQPKCTLQLNHYLHPSLDPAAQWLEHSILRLQAATEITLTRHGIQVQERQCELRRLATVAVQCYASFAAVARASRSYCIGLRHADYEMLAASTFTFDAHLEVKRLAQEVRDGPYLTNDVNHQKVAAQLLRSGGYFAEHPLLRNF